MSAGTYTPARWPMCTGPLAYGKADVTVVLLNFFSIFYILSNYILHYRVLDKPLTLGRSKQACLCSRLIVVFMAQSYGIIPKSQAKPPRQIHMPDT